MSGIQKVGSNAPPYIDDDNSRYTGNTAFEMDVRTDGSVFANGVLVSDSSGAGGTGGSSSGGSSGTSACVNTINVSPTNFKSYWTQIKPTNGIITGTGRRAAGNTIFADYKPDDVALILDATSGSNRYQVQMMFISNYLDANKTIPFRNTGVGTGLISIGAVGRLIAVNGSVNDDWRTNRDGGKNKNMGEIRITAVTPEIRGTYTFKGTGDGNTLNPSTTLNNQYAEVSGRFCIKP